MTYTPPWTQANSQGLLDSSFNIGRCDLREIADVINSRRTLTFQPTKDYLSQLPSGQIITEWPIDHMTDPPAKCLRRAIIDDVLNAPPGQSQLVPTNPRTIQWLWPLADGDADKPISSDTPSPQGCVSLFAKLNGGTTWTDSPLGPDGPVRAIHVNEMRQALSLLCRGRWRLPLFLNVGIFSAAPNTHWFGGSIAHSGAIELRGLGRIWPSLDGRGLVGVRVRSASMEITADTPCRVQILQCLRPIDYAYDQPTWNKYLPAAGQAWGAPGGMGGSDTVDIASVDVTPPATSVATSAGLAAIVQSAINGGPPGFMFRRVDSGPETIDFTATVVVDFDLN